MWRPLGLHIIMVFFIRELNYMASLPVPKTISARLFDGDLDGWEYRVKSPKKHALLKIDWLDE